MTMKPSITPTKRRNSSIAVGPSKASKKDNDQSGGPPSTIPRPANPSNAPNATIISCVTPEKPPKDPNDYRVITLSTGLTVVLVSRKSPPIDWNTSAKSANVACCGAQQLLAIRKSKFSLNHLTPKYHFIQPSLFSRYQDQACHFISTPPACYFKNNQPADIQYQDDKGRYGCTTAAPSTILNRYCTNPPKSTAVAVVVSSGGLDDPESCQGLAHLTEHMVHYGSAKFPEEDSVSSIVVNFGIYNATTESHTTSYFNEVPDLLLVKNLELFSDMLTQPTFSMDVLKREVHAVDNEFYLRLPSLRFLSLFTHVSIQNQSHPLARFICGTLETLGGGTADGNQKLQNEMRKNHQRKYVASAMTLSINSTKSLDELQDLVIHHFSNFLQGDNTILVKSPEDNPPQNLIFQGSKHVYLQGLSSGNELAFLWYLPASLWMNKTQERVIPMIIRMLSETSTVGLDYHLRDRELIYDMVAMHNSTKYATILVIAFSMTEYGSRNTKMIEDLTFNYLAFLQNGAHEKSMKRLFQEMRINNMKDFCYGSQDTSLETTKDFAKRLQHVDASQLLVSESWRDSKYNFASIQQILGHLTKDSLTVIQVVPSDASLTDLVPNGQVKIAPHSKARYVEEPRSNPPAQKGKDGSGLLVVGLGNPDKSTKFGFMENEFLKLDHDTMFSSNAGGGDATGFVLRCPDNWGDIIPQYLEWQSSSDLLEGDYIPKIQGVHLGHFTHGYDCYYSQMSIRFHSPIIFRSNSKTRALLCLWSLVVKQKVSPFASEFRTAGFRINVEPMSDGMCIFVGGFPRHMQDVMKIVVKAMLDEEQEDDERILPTAKVFSLAKQQLNVYQEEYLSESEIISQCLAHCSMYEKADMSMIDFLGSLKLITLEDLTQFTRSFKQSAFAYVELHGNLPIKTFQAVANLLERMPFAPLVDNNPALYNSPYSPLRPNVYCPGETCIRARIFGSVTFTTQVTNLYVLGPYGVDQKQADLFGAAMHFINCQAFMDLRTKQQLGYSVYVTKDFQHSVRVPLMTFAVSVTATAKKHTACELDQKIDKFLEAYTNYLEAMPDELFEARLQLTCSPVTINKTQVASWFKDRFPENFGTRDIKWKCLKAGIKKLSIQVLSDRESLGCDCDICSSVAWEKGHNPESKLMFARGKGVTERYFIASPAF